MLTTDDFDQLNDYTYNGSPQSTADCFMTDCLDVTSDEDFMQQLSSDLDIPLLLNPGDDELGILNSLFDKTPEEILSEITSPVPCTKPTHFSNEINDLQQIDLSQYTAGDFPNLTSEENGLDFALDIKCEPEEFYNSDSCKSASPTPSVSSDSSKNSSDVKEEFIIDTPPISPTNNFHIPIVNNINETIRPINGINKNINTNGIIKNGTIKNDHTTNVHTNGIIKNVVVIPNDGRQYKILPHTKLKIQSTTPYVIPKTKCSNNRKIILQDKGTSKITVLTKNNIVANNITASNIAASNIAASTNNIVPNNNSPINGNIVANNLSSKPNIVSTNNLITTNNIISANNIITPNSNIVTSTTNNAKVVVLDSLKSVPVNSVTSISQLTNIANVTTLTNGISNINKINSTCIPMNNVPVIIKNEPILHPGMDPKAFKRQQRMIKNRESANLSRKKKKEYLTSLEKQVLELSSENQQLKLENAELKHRLAGFMSGKGFSTSLNLLNGNKTLTKSIALCMCLFVVGLNLNITRTPFNLNSPLSKLDSQDLSNIDAHHGRNLLWTEEESSSSSNNTSNILPLPICPMYINQSESVRLALELHRWIGKPFNMSEEFHQENTFETKPKLKTKAKAKQKIKNRSQFENPELFPSIYRWGKKRRLPDQISGNELQVFIPTPEQLYAEFFEAINRRDDTFYVVSFSADHMLLPALHHNKTRRPRMSLIMPSMMPINSSTKNQSNLVPLMQIDCEVVDTRLIQIAHGTIPQHMRAQGNTTESNFNRSSHRNYRKSSDKSRDRLKNKHYKPYFLQEPKPQPKGNYTIKENNFN